MPFSNYLQNKILAAVLNDAAYAAGATVYVGLSTTTPDETSGATNFTEPSGNAYARVAVAANTTNWPAPTDSTSGATVSNATAITFPQATGSWGTVTYAGLFDAATGGNLLAYGALTTPQTISSGGQLSFQAGELPLSLN